MAAPSFQAAAGGSSSGSSAASTSAASGAVAALNSPRIDESSTSRTDTRESSAEPEQAVKSQEKKGWFWTQFMTRTGLFAPLAPEDSPEAVAERRKQEQERQRQEKLESVHRWRPSQDNPTSPVKQRSASGHPARPSMMKRLSSAVELKWWGGEQAAAQAEAEEEEDLQKPKRISRASQSSIGRKDDIPEAANGDIQLR